MAANDLGVDQFIGYAADQLKRSRRIDVRITWNRPKLNGLVVQDKLRRYV